MKIDFKPVLRRIDLSEYTPEMSGAYIDVRVNLSRALIRQILAVSDETNNDEVVQLLHEIWNSEGEEPWPVDDIRELIIHSLEHDPQLIRWIINRSFRLILDYQVGQRKK